MAMASTCGRLNCASISSCGSMCWTTVGKNALTSTEISSMSAAARPSAWRRSTVVSMMRCR
ncbi:Uncharacterised protein [Bordetella pertussis]|nr:Uncharacterised protein [Bordetella pertussis]